LNHSFLLEPGRWTLEGNWLEANEMIAIKGGVIVLWNQQNLFTLAMRIVFVESEREEIICKYRGRLGTRYRYYNYASLRHDLVGQVEGEGWVLPESIIQRYWVLGDRSPKSRTGFENFYRIDRDTYHLSAGILLGYYLSSAMEATLRQQS
jgi:hypothetical protein